jgi:N6-adenosine-specific RNA methylase IME4
MELSNDTKIEVFMIDPPWPKKKGGIRKTRPNQGRELDYQTLPISQITELLVKDIFSKADENHAVFLWVVDEFLRPAEQIMEMLGYKLHARLIWDKGNGIAPAFTVRYSHEYLLWYYKGKFQPIARSGWFKTIFPEKARQHSRKPDFAYLMVDDMYPNKIKMDAFSREYREGWLQYGNQIDYFD